MSSGTFGVTVVLALALLSPAQAASPAETLASRTGEVIGAAAQCGVADEELVNLGRKVIS